MSAWCFSPITTFSLAVVLPLVPAKIQAVTEFPDCDEVDFLCANGACVNSSLLCDGKDDCGDASDEEARFARCSDVLSGGLIAAIVIGCLVGAVLVCCWVGSVIECIQHMYKYWCSCCHPSGDLSDITFTTVIPNPGADPSTLMIATSLPPSYSSIFCQDHGIPPAFPPGIPTGIPPGAIMPLASYAACPRATNSIAVQVPDHSPPGYDHTKSDVRWC